MVPFAQLEPVQVSGVTVKLATLHNEEDLRRKDVRDGRRGDRHARRRRDPAGGLAHRRRRRSARSARARAEAAREVPGLRHADGQARGRRLDDLPQPRLAARASCSRRSSTSSGAMDIDGLGEENARRFLDEGLIEDVGRHLRADGRAADRARGLRRDLGAQPGRRDRGLEAAAVLPRALRARHPRHRLRERAQPGRATSRSMDALLDGRRRGDRRDRRDRARSWPSDRHETLAEERDARADRRACAATGCRWRRRARRRRAEGPLVGKTFVLTGTLPNLTREEATAADRGGRRQGHRLGVEEDRLRGGGRGPGHRS